MDRSLFGHRISERGRRLTAFRINLLPIFK